MKKKKNFSVLALGILFLRLSKSCVELFNTKESMNGKNIINILTDIQNQASNVFFCHQAEIYSRS